jgi:hypothetical protein
MHRASAIRVVNAGDFEGVSESLPPTCVDQNDVSSGTTGIGAARDFYSLL